LIVCSPPPTSAKRNWANLDSEFPPCRPEPPKPSPVRDPFLKALPEGFRYAIEIRNETYLTPQYLAVLARHNVVHAFNAWTRMPPLDQQA
jgi:hypothetical protein